MLLADIVGAVFSFFSFQFGIRKKFLIAARVYRTTHSINLPPSPNHNPIPGPLCSKQNKTNPSLSNLDRKRKMSIFRFILHLCSPVSCSPSSTAALKRRPNGRHKSYSICSLSQAERSSSAPLHLRPCSISYMKKGTQGRRKESNM